MVLILFSNVNVRHLWEGACLVTYFLRFQGCNMQYIFEIYMKMMGWLHAWVTYLHLYLFCSSISTMSTSHSHHTTIVHASIVNTSFSNEDQFCTQFCVIYPKTDRIKITPPRVWLGFDLKLMGQFF